MSFSKNIAWVKAQIVDTERMLQLAHGEPLMTHSLTIKLNNLRRELEQFPQDVVEPKVQLLFSGQAVKGSSGIKSTFVSKVIKPFQELVKTQTALIRFGHVKDRGPTKRSANSELYLTALPVGSFGLELSQIESDDLFDGQDVSEAIRDIILLIDATARGEEQFETAIEYVPKRNLTNLKAFLSIVAAEHSVLKIESGGLGIEIPAQAIVEASQRVSETRYKEQEIIVNGTLRGILLDSGRFEVISNNGIYFSGLIGQDLKEEDLVDYNRRFLNQPCQIHMREYTTTFKTGRKKTTHELLEINPIAD